MNHSFHSYISLTERYKLNSRYSLIFAPEQEYAIGETIIVTGVSISHTLTPLLYFSETLNYEANLNPYPNPTSASTSLSSELANVSDVNI